MATRAELSFSITVFIALLSSLTTAIAQSGKELVRLAVIEVDTSQVGPYFQYLKEEIEASVRLEPGVTTLFGVAEQENPERVTLFETYADSAQYKAHLATPHFQKYKQGTLEMVKNLELIEMKALLYHRKAELSKARSEDLFVRLIKMEIDSSALENFNKLGTTVMLPGIKKEPGVLVMYVVAEKNRPTRISILEVYRNIAAYNKHLKTPHYLTYKEESKNIVRGLKLIDGKQIALGSKPQH